jgi:hypothetical protein
VAALLRSGANANVRSADNLIALEHAAKVGGAVSNSYLFHFLGFYLELFHFPFLVDLFHILRQE